jgi:hypothetical protein
LVGPSENAASNPHDPSDQGAAPDHTSGIYPFVPGYYENRPDYHQDATRPKNELEIRYMLGFRQPDKG